MFVNTDNTEIHTLGLFAMTYVITSVLNITFELSLLKQLTLGPGYIQGYSAE